MPTRVVNKYKEEYDVYIGRGSLFGNPYIIGPDGTRAEVLEKYGMYFWGRLFSDDDFREQVKSLRGKRLGCYCKPQECHGDLLRMIADADDSQGNPA